MKNGYSAGAAAIFLLTFLCSPARAVAIDPLADPFAGVDFDFGVFATLSPTETLHYDAASRRLSYTSIGAARFSFAFDDPFNSVFAWEATVDASGEVLDGGSMLWLGDFGAGDELLATGRVRDIGFFSTSFDEDFGYGYLSFRAVFENLFLGPAAAAFGPRMGLFMELQIISLDAPIFSADFHCSLAAPRSCPGQGDYFSDSGLTKIAVAEPPASQVFAVLLAALGLGSLRRRRLTPRQTMNGTTRTPLVS